MGKTGIRTSDPREQVEKECAGHPGEVEIHGAKLDLAVPEDAALAAKWLDYQCAALAQVALRKTADG
jgi:hypothetical protein